MHHDFEGIWVPIVTPFHDDTIDRAALARLARHLADKGIAGLVAGATTGEGALLRDDELAAVFSTLRESVPKLPIVLGLSSASTRAAADTARWISAWAPDGLLVTPPPYVRPGAEGLRRHFEAVVEAADLPVLIYDIPYRTAVSIEIETLQALAHDERVVGIKECGGSLERMQRLLSETPLRVLSGDDNQNFAALCLGAHGTIAATAHVLPEWHVRIFELLRGGRLIPARRLSAALQPIVRDLFLEPNPAPLKAWLAQQGWCAADVRLPFVPASAALRRRLQADWQVLCAFDPESEVAAEPTNA